MSPQTPSPPASATVTQSASLPAQRNCHRRGGGVTSLTALFQRAFRVQVVVELLPTPTQPVGKRCTRVSQAPSGFVGEEKKIGGQLPVLQILPSPADNLLIIEPKADPTTRTTATATTISRFSRQCSAFLRRCGRLVGRSDGRIVSVKPRSRPPRHVALNSASGRPLSRREAARRCSASRTA